MTDLASSPAQPAAITTERLSVRYGRQSVLEELSLVVPTGGVYALLGRNGTGKSSLVRCVLGCQRPQGGRLTLLGGDPWARRAELMARVGVVPETPDAPPAMTAGELGGFCARLYPRWAQDRYDAQLRRFGIGQDRPFGKLSRGQKTQVAIALALAPTPELLILDDPTLGLDAVARKAVLEELVTELADRGTTVFLTTHDLAGVEQIADRVGILQGCRLLVDEELETLRARFRRLTWPVAAGQAPVAASSSPLPPEGSTALGLIPNASTWGASAVVSRFDADRLSAALAGGPPPQVEALTLDAIFVALTGQELAA